MLYVFLQQNIFTAVSDVDYNEDRDCVEVHICKCSYISFSPSHLCLWINKTDSGAPKIAILLISSKYVLVAHLPCCHCD